MKKKFNLTFAIILIIILVIPIGIVIMIANERKNNNTNVSNINFNNLAEALDYYQDLYDNTDDDKAKDKLINILKEYVLNNINGNYYIYNKEGYKKNSNRFIYIKSNDEVYIIPFEDNEISVNNLDELDNLELYKYKIINVDIHKVSIDEKEYNQVTVKFQNYLTTNKVVDNISEYYKYIYLHYITKDNYYVMNGFFADTISDNDDFSSKSAINSKGYFSYNYYYKTKSELEAKVQEDTKVKEEKSNLKKSIPKVGMTTNEVKQTKWGLPDKINKDTYSWGTTEQWVYNKYGYVYFKNGTVTSVSER